MSDVYYDQYSVEINADPYPVYKRLREEAPIYYNDTHDFFAVSRFEDVEKGLLDAQTYISGKGAILEVIKADIDIPPGVIIFEDPPTHTIHRRLLSPRLHSAARSRARAEDPRVLRPQPRSTGRLRRLRFHRRSRCADAHACHQHAPRHSRERSGSRARPRGCEPSNQGRRTDAGDGELRHRGDVRGLRRLASRAPLRRHHDGAPQRRVRR